MKKLLLTGVLAFSAGQAWAADLPPAAPPPPRAPAVYIPAPPPVYNWGGIYIGINGGGGLGSSTWTTPAASSGSFNADGFMVGGTLGANYQINQFVLGIEGDIDWQDYDGTSGAGCGGLGATVVGIGTAGCETKSDWLATVRGRVGYAFDRVLVFGTAGGAVGSVQTGLNPEPAGLSSNSQTEFGWTAGGGLEYAFTDNITAKVEYLFVDLGSNASCSSGCALTTIAAPPAAINPNAQFYENVIRAGINFKFGGF